METANPQYEDRHGAIATALDTEIDRQAKSGANRIDVNALAVAVEDAITPTRLSLDGKSPSELNATNDD
jgi:hypothetical protein